MKISKEKEILSVIIPIYNEEACIDELVKRLLNLKESFTGVELSCIFVNDGSEDRSLDMLINYAQRYDFFKIINLSRNFGHQLAITAGMDYVDADYIVIIDADLQDPPELITKLYDKINEGYDVVYAKRDEREGESCFKLITARWFYRLINRMCRVDIPSNTGDFRMMNSKLLVALKCMREQHRFVRGMIPWLGFKSAPLHYNRERRFAGETKYPFRRMFRFAMDAIFSFSSAPLRFASYLGVALVLFGILGGILLLYLRFFTSYYAAGITTVILAIVIMSGMQIIMIGIVGEYIGRIFEEAKGRPLYVVDCLVNFSDQQKK